MIFAQPTIPSALLHDMFELRTSGKTYSPENGGQYVGGETERVKFRGAVLPLTAKDIERMEPGTYSRDSKKVYTNGHAMQVGAQVYDPQNDATYTISADLDYGVINSRFRRYVVDRKGATAQK